MDAHLKLVQLPTKLFVSKAPILQQELFHLLMQTLRVLTGET
jgi:hypothetical protein